MSLTAADFLAPQGDLEVSWFAPLKSAAVDERLDGWITQGASKASAIADEDRQADAVRAWTYYKAYEHIATALARKAKSVTLDAKDTRVQSTKDTEYFTNLSKSWYDVFLALVPIAPQTTDFTPSMSVKHRTGF